MKFSRICVGLLLGLACGACTGAAGFAVSASLFGRGIGLIGPSPRLAAVIGAGLVGLPGAAVGAIVGAFDLGRAQGLWVGVAAGSLMAWLTVWRGGHRYYYEGGYFDRQRLFEGLLDSATAVLGLAFVAVVVSASARKFFAPGR